MGQTEHDAPDRVPTRARHPGALAAEQQWDRFLWNFAHQWHPDIGLCADAPKLNPAGEYALRQIGGYPGFAGSKHEHEGLMRDRFMEAYGRFHIEGGEQTKFSQELSERLLKQLRGEEPIQLRGHEI